MRKGEELQTGQSHEAYRYIDECIKSHSALVFNPGAALEWVEGEATAKSACEIAAIIDSATLKYRLEEDTFVYTREILDECHTREQHLRVPDFPILQKLCDNGFFYSVHGIVATQVTDYFEEEERERLQRAGHIPTEIPVLSVQVWVEETLRWKEENPETYQERIDGFNAALSEDIERKDEYFSDREGYRKDWIKRYLKVDRILKAFNPEVQIDVDGLLHRIDIRKCAAVNLYWKVREKRMRSGNPPEDNDVDDYMFLPVIPYADIVLTERNLRAFVLQADSKLGSKVFSKVSDALDALKNYEFAW